MEPPARRDARALKDAMFGVFSAMPKADPKQYVRGQYEGYRKIKGVAKDSKTETFAAMRFEIDNWRWSGVPFFIRTGKELPVEQWELRLIFKEPPRLGYGANSRRRPEPDELVVRLHPTTGIRLLVDAQRGEDIRPEQINLDMECDLAKVMTFNSLYRLEARGLLDCPIVGVAFDDWSDKDLRDHARKAIETSSGKKPDPKIFNRLAKRLSYIQGDFAKADTYERLAAHIKGAKTPVFYLEIPPSLFGMTIKGLARGRPDREREGGGREALRPRPRLRPRACRGDPSVHP